jgi:TRAP-type uncharacterized transport system fused permease subunit
MFVYEPSLLLIFKDDTSYLTVFWSVMTAMIGVIALAGGFFGWLVGYATTLHRVLLFISAICLIKPGLITDTIGFSFLAFVAISQWYQNKKTPGVAA